MPHRRRLLTALIASLLLLAPAAVAPAQTLQTLAELHVEAANLGRGSVGLLITDLDTGEPMAALSPDLPLIPASNMKLLTTAAALSILGEDHVLSTELRLAGRTLIVRGSGDPGFADPELLGELGMDVEQLLDRWVRAVGRAGLDRLDALIVDDRAFDRQFFHTAWPQNQMHRWYCAQVAGLNFNDNCLDVYATPTRPGHPPELMILPSRAPITIDNGALTGDENRFGAARRPNTNDIVISGELSHALTRPVHVTVHDPPLLFAETLTAHLEAAGIRVDQVRRAEPDESPPAGRLLAAYHTTLPSILVRCNRDSQNLFAEALVKYLGHRLTGRPGSWTNGAAAVRLFLAEAIGPDAADIVIDDGSGMSRNNRLTAAALNKLLAYMHGRRDLAELYIASLATPGGDGTLEKRFTGARLRGAVHAKSGYLNGVVCLSGYILQDSRAACFSIFVNGDAVPVYRARQMAERIVEDLDARLAADEPVKLGG